MKKTLLIALLAVAVMAVPAFASVQNIKVGGDIESTFLVRDQFDFGRSYYAPSADVPGAGDADYYQQLLITQTRLWVSADLTDNVSATVSLINERVWGEEEDDAGDTDVDLNLAYVTLREMLYSPLTVVIGRQNFKYGNSFVVDSGGTNNVNTSGNGLSSIANDLTKRTAQDAVRLILDYNPLTVELLASKIDANNNSYGSANRPHKDDVDLYGINANYNLGDAWKTVVEGYFFAKFDTSVANGPTGTVGLKADSVLVPGLRASTNPIKGLNVQGEVAWQMGNKASTSTTSSNDNVRRAAFGGQFIASYAIPLEMTAKWSPTLTTAYTYVSGDEDPEEPGGGTATRANGQDEYTAWDPMFENQAGGKIYNSLYDYSNAHLALLEGSIKPLDDLTLKGSWTGLWLDKAVIPEQISGATLASLSHRLPTGTITHQVTTNKDVGYEIDGDLLYDYTEDVQIGLSAGWFFPGGLYLHARDTASQYLGKVNVKF